MYATIFVVMPSTTIGAGAAAAGVAVAAVGGAAIASANTAAAASNDYNAGVAAGGGTVIVAPMPSVESAMGGVYPVLPAGCSSGSVQGQTYYVCGSTRFQPACGANGVYYRLVPIP